MLCAMASGGFDVNSFIQQIFECLVRGGQCSKCWVYSSEQGDQVLFISHDSHTEVVLALMCDFLPHQHICLLIRGQQADFPIVTVAA